MRDHLPKNCAGIVVLDVGTYASGWGYSVKGHPKPIFFYEWLEKRRYIKNLSVLWYQQNHAQPSKQWGWNAYSSEAQQKHKQNKQSGRKTQKSEDTFARYFKTALKTWDWERNGCPIWRSDSGREFRVQDLMEHLIRFLSDHALTHMMRKEIGVLNEEIVWCLTIPAIWDSRHERVMRDAAVAAELVPEPFHERLWLLRESEAALLGTRDSVEIRLQAGDTVCVVDVGGGTTDLFSGTYKATRGFDELPFPLGGISDDWHGGSAGGKDCERRFNAFLNDTFSEELVRRFQKDNPIDDMQLMVSFEAKKCAFDPNLSGNQLVGPISWFLGSDRLPDGRVQYRMDEATVLRLQKCGAVIGDYLSIDKSKMLKFFVPVIAEVLRFVKVHFEAHKRHTDYLFLVGGFAECPLLRDLFYCPPKEEPKWLDECDAELLGGSSTSDSIESIRSWLKWKWDYKPWTHYHAPESPGEMVLRGALSYVLNPSAIRPYRTKLTYGIEVADEFEAGDPEEWCLDTLNPDDPSKKKKYCQHRFHTLFRKGAVVGGTHEAFISVGVENSNELEGNKDVVFDVFSTPEPDGIRYTQRCEQVGKVCTLPKLTIRGLKRGIKDRIRIEAVFDEKWVAISAEDVLEPSFRVTSGWKPDGGFNVDERSRLES